ncbi:tyrosine-type recombinase/integrase [Klebsiella quasipneumoniae]|uniref:tyrosine-type recombinase/integrase n=1 Tax=Klebsiella quasipneumoniae TaxID=1463165 RepID=UPI000808FDAA|nr:site-specific integrase [Klebsiella quasipneumoniae]GKP46894.1 integrase [Klebsiella quasipneumoniae]SBZ96023.1 phage integrase [Klebsiella quasipneumoniae]SCA18299.1 phage integrase [Klebsiella quasipneumoniae]HCI9052455.1 site-specific integrase [Klebsiella quasipneumoniae]
MGIYQRGNIWYADYKNSEGKRVRKSMGTIDKKLASELYDKVKYESWRSSKLGYIPRVTFEKACIRWLKEKSGKKTLCDDKKRIKFWQAFFGTRYLDEITVDMIYQAVNSMINQKYEQNWRAKYLACSPSALAPSKYVPKAVSIATKNTHLAFMKALLRKSWLEWKWLEKMPYIRLYPVKNTRVRWLKPYEAKKLINACSEPLKSVVEFALATGLRRSNIINLKWQQVDITRRVAWIPSEESKSGQAIGVALNQSACDILERQVGKHSQWVFVHTSAKHRPDGTLTPAVRKMRVDDNNAWRAALKKAGIKDFRFHDLRHTWASWLVQAGVPLSALQEMGGWESIEMVKKYAHLSPTHLLIYAQKLDSILREG